MWSIFMHDYYQLAFLLSLTRKYMLWKSFYHDFSTWKAPASGGTKGLCPLDPKVALPALTIYPGAVPVYEHCVFDLRTKANMIQLHLPYKTSYNLKLIL